MLHQVQVAFLGGMSAMLWACAALCLLAAVLTATFIRVRQPDRVREPGAAESIHVG
jgi:hypothetical protein